MLRTLFFSLFILSTSFASAQHALDTILYSKILLVPYHPMMHLSDADEELARDSEQSREAMRTQFRTGLLHKIDATLLSTYRTFILESDVNGDAQTDLETIYGTLNYVTDTVYPVKFPQKNVGAKKDTVSLTKKLFGKKQKPAATQYMNVTLAHPELLQTYSRKYGTDLFVFLNQVEIITHAKDCYDLALKTYQRDIKVHYSVYDTRGKQVYGDVAVAHVSGSSGDLQDMIRTVFPEIGNYVYRHIPPKDILAVDGQ